MRTRVVHFRKEPFDVYIGRPSKWANPFTTKPWAKYGTLVAPGSDLIEMYREWISTQHALLEELSELRGKVLGCWCRPGRCHGDVLVELIEERWPRTAVIF